MNKHKRMKWLSVVVIGGIMLNVFVGCSSVDQGGKQGISKEAEVVKENSKEKDKENTTEKEDELIVIKYGSHEGNRENPNYIDPITGEYTMDEVERKRKLEALEVVKEELGVELQFVQYPGNVTEVLLQSILAGDPICDIARIATGGQGTILGQNILQPVDEYIELLGENPPPKVYGKQYFIRVRGNQSHSLSPLRYDINYIEDVPGLKVDGKTVYPTDLYEDGNWTWSVFKEYLEVIDTYYQSSKGPIRPEKRIDAYHTNYQEAALLAIHSNGGSIYGAEGLGIESEETLEAVGYIQQLIDEELLKTNLVEGTSIPVNDAESSLVAFKNGESVFTNFHGWRSNAITKELAKREHSLGYIPFPRPDDMSVDDINYRQARVGGESYAILKGVEEDLVPIAIETYFLYENTLDEIHLREEGVPRVDVVLVMDRFHPEIGVDLDTIYQESIAKTFVNELGDTVNVTSTFNTVMGDALWGINNSPSFEVAIEQNKGQFLTRVDEMESILATDQVRDNIAPQIDKINEKEYSYPIGTDLTTVNFKEDFEAIDNLEGAIDVNNFKVDTTGVNTNVAGDYGEGLVLKITDSVGNERSQNFKVTIYSEEITQKPTIELKDNYRTIKVGEDTSKINWGKDFLAKVVDQDNIDLKHRVQVDLSELDTTTPGEYTVIMSVEDHRGETASVQLEVVVKSN